MVYFGHVYSEILVMTLTDFSKTGFGGWDSGLRMVVPNSGWDVNGKEFQ